MSRAYRKDAKARKHVTLSLDQTTIDFLHGWKTHDGKDAGTSTVIEQIVSYVIDSGMEKELPEPLNTAEVSK
jgi:hypothetical protein